jgi:hypothetical protein
MNPTDLQSVLSAVLRIQEQRFVQLLDALRVVQSTSAAIMPPAHGNSPLSQLSDIESFLMEVEHPTHFEDWLKRFEISLLCAAPKISEKEKTMVLATNVSTDDLPNSVRAGSLNTSQTTVTKMQWQGSVFSSVSNVPYLRTVTTACASFGAKGKSSCTWSIEAKRPEEVQVRRVD